MAKTNAWSTTLPPDTGESAKIGAQRIRGLSLAVKEAFAVDHKTGTTPDSDDATGEHKQITFTAARTAPSTVAEAKGVLYPKDVGGKTELFWIDEDLHEKQITSAGKLLITSTEILGILANATYLTAIDEAGTGTVNLIKAGRNEADDADVAVLPDLVRTETNAAPLEDTAIANKKYVDDAITAIGGLFGVWDDRDNDGSADTVAINTEYTAITDGIVTAYWIGTNAAISIETPVGTTRISDMPGQSVAGFSAGVSCPVRRGDTWKAVSSAAATVHWLPIGAVAPE